MSFTIYKLNISKVQLLRQWKIPPNTSLKLASKWTQWTCKNPQHIFLFLFFNAKIREETNKKQKRGKTCKYILMKKCFSIYLEKYSEFYFLHISIVQVSLLWKDITVPVILLLWITLQLSNQIVSIHLFCCCNSWCILNKINMEVPAVTLYHVKVNKW